MEESREQRTIDAWSAVTAAFLLVVPLLSILYFYPLIVPGSPATWIPIGCVGLSVLMAVGTIGRARPGQISKTSDLEGCFQGIGCLPLLVIGILLSTYLANRGIRAATAGGSHWQRTDAVVESWNLDE